MDFFKKFSNKKAPKDVAKDRLKLILIHDRGNLSEVIIEKIRTEILEAISKYIEIDVSDVEIAVNQTENIEDNKSTLIANIPIKNIKGR